MDPDEELFGIPRLRKVLSGQPECPIDQLQKCILEAVENFARGASQADDLTLLIVRYRAAGARSTTDTDAAPVTQSATA
jgi:sigma-B regulation protein RsbU (phosphoserine phosphatase)